MADDSPFRYPPGQIHWEHIEAVSIATHRGDGDKETAWDEGRVLIAAVLAVQIAVDVD
jgi:hypothetical protein